MNFQQCNDECFLPCFPHDRYNDPVDSITLHVTSESRDDDHAVITENVAEDREKMIHEDLMMNKLLLFI